MSRVYRGQHITLSFPVAIKMASATTVPGHLAGSTSRPAPRSSRPITTRPGSRPAPSSSRAPGVGVGDGEPSGEDETARLTREAKLLARVQSEHVVSVLDAGNTRAGERYFVMEFLDGPSLYRAWRDRMAVARSHPLADVCEVGAQIAVALADVHDSGIVHRDIKPTNVVVTGARNRVSRRGVSLRCVLVDFGIAATVEELATRRNLRQVWGTPSHMSPEQAGGRQVGTATDIYSLGVMLFQLITGRLPFHGATPSRMMAAHVHQPPPSVRRLASWCPHELAAIVHRCLLKAPTKRPTASELECELRRIGSDRGAVSRSVQSA